MDVDEHDNANIDDPRYATNVVSASKKMMVMMMVMMMVVMMVIMHDDDLGGRQAWLKWAMELPVKTNLLMSCAMII